jgi:uncharacterized protein
MYYQTTITLTTSRLQALISLLDKAYSQALERGMSESDFINLSLTEDMFPLKKQIQIASDNAKGMVSRLSGKEAPKMEDNEETVEQLKTRLTRTIDYLATFSESDFENASESEARFPWFPGMHMKGQGYLLGYGLPNFFFHVVTTYSILRHHGFEIGKADFMGGSLELHPDAK